MEAARRERDVAVRELEDAVRQANRYLASTNPSPRLIQQRILKIQEKEERLRLYHYTYCEKGKISVDDKEQVEFLTKYVDAAMDCTDKCMIIMDDIENERQSTANAETEQKRNVVKDMFYEQMRAEVDVEEHIALEIMTKLEGILSNELTDNSVTLIKIYQQRLYESMENLNKSWKSVITACYSSEELQRLTDEISKNKMSLENAYSNATVALENYLGRESNLPTMHPPTEVFMPGTAPVEAKLTVKPEKMKLPIFSGNIRNYARFKKNIKEIILPFYPDSTHRVFVIKESCLKGTAKTLVENVEDIEEIWRRLDDKFGDKIDLVDVVIKDLENLPCMRANEDQKFIQLVDTLEKGLLDLEAVEAKADIANAYTVKMIESKLSRQLYLTWLKEGEGSTDNAAGNSGSQSRFEKMLIFLQNERRHRLKLMRRTPEQPSDKQIPKHQSKQNSYGTRDIPGDYRKIQKCLLHNNATHFTRKCRMFLEKTPEERAAILKETKACHLCLSTGHPDKSCPFKENWGPCKFANCGKFHSHLLHEADHRGLLMCASIKTMIQPAETSLCHSVTSQSTVNQPMPSSEVLLLIQEIPTDHGKVVSFFDNGSTVSLVSKGYTMRNKLRGVKISYQLVTVGGKASTHHTYLHSIKLIDSEGKPHEIDALEIDDICGKLNDVDISSVIGLFSNLNKDDVRRKAGNIELLIGMKHANIHPVPIDQVDGLILFSSRFGTNRILGGTHPLLKESGYMEKAAAIVAHSQIRNTRVMFDKHLDSGIDFFTSEEFGVKLIPRCDRCTNCKNCTYEVHQMSKIEQRELTTIENNLMLDPLQKRWITQYPYTCDPSVLLENQDQVKSMLLSTEKRLSRSEDTRTQYKQQFNDFIERGVFRKLEEEEMLNHKGPVFYVPHHEVYKEGSSSTPMRIVINSSMQFKGKSLNDILMKGPNTLNDLYGVQLRFRSYEIAVVCDIAKMYHSIKTTEMERHLRRVMWRDVDVTQEIQTYGTEVMMFGDRPAATIATVALRKTATIYQNINEEAATKIKRDCYVDDIVTGAEDVEATESLKSGITEILEKGGFKPKGFVTSGDTSKEPLSLLGSGSIGRVLGMGWEPEKDEFQIKVRINFSKKDKKGRINSDVEHKDIPAIVDMRITKRLLLSFVNSCYEPLGLYSPITIQMKILLRKLYSKENPLNWDDDIPKELKKEWVDVILKMKQCEAVTFKRCVKPPDVIGDPELIICSDGSEQAICTAAYIRWTCTNGIKCNLWTAKSRVTPIKKLTIPRIEMQSAVMSVRLSESIKRNSIWKFSHVYHIIDSLCTLATLRKDTSALREFMGNRVAEIMDTTTINQWYHVNSKRNIADLGTRCNAEIEDVLEDSEWQRGSKWMSAPIHEWPVTQDVDGSKIPLEEVLSLKFCGSANIAKSVLHYEKYIGKSYNFIVNLTARVLKISRTKSFRNNEITVDDKSDAESFILKSSMQRTEKALKEGKLMALKAQKNENGIIVLQSRAVDGLRTYYDCDQFPILTYDDPVSLLWIKLIHNEDHGGITKVVAKSRRKFWIIRARKLASKVKGSCYVCRLRDKVLAQQVMAPLPISRITMSPTFHEISLDLFGPFEIKDTVKQRSRKKVWGIVLNCVATRAVHIDVTEDYGADAFLQVLRKFVSIRGCPSVIHCDKGSQLQAAWDDFKQWTLKRNIKLKTTPAEGQHQNGLSESLVKSIKNSLFHTIGRNVLTFSGLQMVFFEVASIINSRPIGVISGSDPTCPDPITPNHIILGRSTPDVAVGPFDNTRDVNKRYMFLMRLVAEWWNMWYDRVLPSLVPSYKWLQRHRNVKLGDIALIRYKKDVKATYRLGKVIDVQKGVDGLVRKVVLKYKLPQENVHRLVDRPIHGISVIVPVEEQGPLDLETTQLNPNADEFYPVKKGNK